MQYAAIDNGYFQTKALISNELSCFPSRITKDDEGAFEFDGIKYTVGQGNYNIEHDKSNNDLHKLLTYFALSKNTVDKEIYKLTLSLPMQRYKTYKDEFKDYIKHCGVIECKYKGVKKVIVIDDVYVFLQGAGALYARNTAEYRGKLIGILDIGGLTCQAAIFDDLKMIKESTFCIDAGTIIFSNKIKHLLNEKYKLNIQDYEIPYIIKSEKYKKDIDYLIAEHLEMIKNEMLKNNWNLNEMQILATGGGSMLLNVNKYFNNCKLSDNPIFDNVIGLNNVGRAKMR